MTLPKSVRIGYRTYQIKEWSKEDARGAGFDGWCDRTAHIIKVRTDPGPIEAANTLLHEILHACWTNLPGISGDQEEAAVSMLSDNMLQMWRDNPEIIRFISKAVSEK